jgi:hypothetical protein
MSKGVPTVPGDISTLLEEQKQMLKNRRRSIDMTAAFTAKSTEQSSITQ